MRRTTLFIVGMALIASVVIGLLVGELAGGGSESEQTLTPLPTVLAPSVPTGTPVSRGREPAVPSAASPAAGTPVSATPVATEATPAAADIPSLTVGR